MRFVTKQWPNIRPDVYGVRNNMATFNFGHGPFMDGDRDGFRT